MCLFECECEPVSVCTVRVIVDLCVKGVNIKGGGQEECICVSKGMLERCKGERKRNRWKSPPHCIIDASLPSSTSSLIHILCSLHPLFFILLSSAPLLSSSWLSYATPRTGNTEAMRYLSLQRFDLCSKAIHLVMTEHKVVSHTHNTTWNTFNETENKKKENKDTDSIKHCWTNSSISMNSEFIHTSSRNSHSQIITKLASSLITASPIQSMLDGIICCEIPLRIPISTSSVL